MTTLSYVGRSNIAGANHVNNILLTFESGAYDNSDPMTGTFVPDGAGFLENDLLTLIILVEGGPPAFAPSTGWSVYSQAWAGSWGTSAPVWYLCYHVVTAAEATSTALTYTVTDSGISSGSSNWMGWGEGVASRAPGGFTMVVDTANIHFPSDGDVGDDWETQSVPTDNTLTMAANLFATRTGPGIEYAVSGAGGGTVNTYDGVVWGDLIETAENSISSPAQETWTSAYRFLASGVDATDTAVSWAWSTGGSRLYAAVRGWIPVTLTASGPPDEEGGNQGWNEFWDVFDGTTVDSGSSVTGMAFPDLNDVQDVITSTASVGSLVRWDGTQWVGVTTLDGGSP
jgi:hypothetical protein